MRLDDYLTSSTVINDLAAAIGCKPAQIRQWKSTAKVKRLPGAAYCSAIERATHGAVKRSDLRPDWREIWPEIHVSQSSEPTGRIQTLETDTPV